MFILAIIIICAIGGVVYSIAEKRKGRKAVETFVATSSIPEQRDGMNMVLEIIKDGLNQLKSIFERETFIPYSDVDMVRKEYNERYWQIRDLVKYLPLGSEERVLTNNLLEYYLGLEERRKAHNKQVVEQELEICKEYFDTVLEYPLDLQQRQAIVNLEDNTLVVSSAGSGKTSTICGKVRYLVDKVKIDPTKILLITYTRKAAESLSERLNIPGLRCYTFHKLAIDTISNFTKQKPSICPDSIFVTTYELLKKDSNFLKAVNRYFASYQTGMKDEFEYEDAASYIADRKKYGIQSPYPDMNGCTIYTRSEQEKKICVFLSENGVKFKYEQPYEYSAKDGSYRQYQPDFTIYYVVDGVRKHLYLEHFGVDANGNVPKWFGDGEEGGWPAANRKYREGIEWKKQLHLDNNTDLIYTTSADFYNQTIYDKLRRELEAKGVKFSPLSEEQKSKYLLDKGHKKEQALIEMLSSFIMLMKGRCKTMDEVLAMLPTVAIRPEDRRNRFVLCSLILPFYNQYVKLLKERGEIDFTDAILWATQLCLDQQNVEYDYILVDEFQDISFDRYKFLKALRRTHPTTRLFCVGDDWQSIYRFSGSDLTLFTSFEKFFGYTNECNLGTTYRFGNPLLDLSSEFIKKNPLQKNKRLAPFSNDCVTDYELVWYLGGEESSYFSRLRAIVDSIPEDKSVMFIGRYTMDVEPIIAQFDGELVGDKVFIKWSDSRKIPFLTVHQAKGLEADYVILLKCNSGTYGFPTMISDDPILSVVLSEDEKFPFGEERRVFYVGITRSKIKTFIMYDIEHPSHFVEELGEIAVMTDEPEVIECPKCKLGHLVSIKSGLAKSGYHFTSYVCSNQNFGCDYFTTTFYH